MIGEITICSIFLTDYGQGISGCVILVEQHVLYG